MKIKLVVNGKEINRFDHLIIRIRYVRKSPSHNVEGIQQRQGMVCAQILGTDDTHGAPLDRGAPFFVPAFRGTAFAYPGKNTYF